MGDDRQACEREISDHTADRAALVARCVRLAMPERV
jgi:hypothetical protein